MNMESEMTNILAAVHQLTIAADLYDRAKEELAALLAATASPKRTEPAQAQAAPRKVKKRAPSRPVAPPAEPRVSPSSLSAGARILALVADGTDWSVSRLADTLKLDPRSFGGTLSILAAEGALRRVSRGVYAKGDAEPKPKKPRGGSHGNKDHALPTADGGGLTPLEKRIATSGKTQALIGRKDGRQEYDPPTAEERILAALGSGPKKWSELPVLCSLTTKGASDALAALSAANKVTSYNGVWKLKEAA